MSITIDDLKSLADLAVKNPPVDDVRLEDFSRNPGYETFSDENPSWWPYYEFLRLLARAMVPERITDLGTELGRSCFYMATGSPNSMVTTVECGGRPPDTYLRFLGQCANVHIVMGMDTAEWGLTRLSRGDYFSELVFIDTSHTHRQTLLEWGIYRNLMRFGGVAVFDDVDTDGVRGAWNEIGLPKIELPELHKGNGFGAVLVPRIGEK